MKTDTERLDFIIARLVSFGSQSDYTVTPSAHAKFCRVECVQQYHWHCYDGETPRDALDAAMDAPPCSQAADGNCNQTIALQKAFVARPNARAGVPQESQE